MAAQPDEPLSWVQSTRKRMRRRVKEWRLRRRRARQAKKKGGGRRMTVVLALLVTFLLGAFAWSLWFLLSGTPTGRQLTLDQVAGLSTSQRIESATFLDEDNRVVGRFAKPAAGAAANTGGPTATVVGGSGDYWAAYPKSGAAFGPLYERLTASGAAVRVDQQARKAVVRAVATFLLPLLILAGVFGLLFASGKGGGGGIGEVLSFGTIGKKRQKRGLSAPTTFADVGSAEEAVTELSEVVDYLRDPEKYDAIGAVPPKGVLLFGPPGCGKTLLAKAVAGEAGVPFFSVAGAEFVESLVGVGAARVRDLFARVRAVAPAIVFIDELDAAGRRRGSGGGEGGSDEREQTLNQLLVEMDGFEVSAGVVVMGATNRPDILDPALLRPGRFDRHITIEQPDHQGRTAILQLHARGKNLSPDVDLEYVAKRTPGFSGADLASVVNEAALLTLRQSKPFIETPELEEAIQRVLHGPQKRGELLTPEEERRTALHESGHAVAAVALGQADDLHRVTILARGGGLGGTTLRRDGKTSLLTRSQLYAKLVVALAGVAAEEMELGEPSTGSEDDLQAATSLARDIAGRFGMSPALGRPRLLASDVDVFLGGGSSLAGLSGDLHTTLHTEVRRLLTAAERDAAKVLRANHAALTAMAAALEADETLEGAALTKMLSRVKAGPPLRGPFAATRDSS